MSEPNYGLFRGVEITTLVLAVLFLILRLTNRWMRKTITLDDGIMILAVVLAFIITILVFQLYHFGYGRLDEDIPPEWKIPIGKLSIAIFTTFPTCYSLIRISIVLTYLRLFPAQTNRWFCFALFGVQAAYAVWAGLMVLLQCKPIKGYWLADIEKECIDPKNQDIAILALNSTFDIIVYTWPVHYLYKLNLPVKSRIGLVVLFSIGLVNIGLSFTRLSLLLAMYTTKQWTKYGIWGCMCIVLEAHIGIMCACLPYLRFIYEYMGKFATSLSSRSRSRTKTKSKQSDPNHDGHPFQQLNEAREGGRIHKTSEFVISTFHEDEDNEIDRPAHVPKTYVRNDPVRNDIRRMENDFDRRKEEEQKKRSGESVLLEDNFPRAVK